MTKSLITVYNGTNHDLSVYIPDDKNFTSNRYHDDYTLLNPEITPAVVFPLQNPLSVNKISFPPMHFDNLQFSFPKSYVPQSILESVFTYDCIVVSNQYADFAKSGYYNADFLDRIYTADKYVKDPNGRTIGITGFRRVTLPYNVSYYAYQFEHGKKPSLAAAMMSLYLYQNNPNQHEQAEAYKLYICINSEIQRRQQGVTGFNTSNM